MASIAFGSDHGAAKLRSSAIGRAALPAQLAEQMGLLNNIKDSNGREVDLDHLISSHICAWLAFDQHVAFRAAAGQHRQQEVNVGEPAGSDAAVQRSEQLARSHLAAERPW